MENLDKSWEKLSQSLEQEGVLSKNEILGHLSAESKQPLHKLKANVGYKLIFAIGFMPIFIFLAILLEPILVKILMAIVALGYAIAAYLIYNAYQKLKKNISMDQPAISAISETLDVTKKVLKHEMIFYILVFPFSLTGGFMTGLSMETGNLDILAEHPFIWWILLGLHIIVYPLGYWISNKMNQRSFGKYIQQLEEMLDSSKRD